MGMIVKGFRQLRKTIQTLEKKAQKTLIEPGLREAGKQAVKVIKADIPGRYKDVRKSIGWRIKQKNKQRFLKVGAAVGFRGARRERFIQRSQKRRKGHPGVGISPANVHWWFIGTTFRVTKNEDTPQFTGVMPVMHRGIDQIVQGHIPTMRRLVATSVRLNLRKAMK